MMGYNFARIHQIQCVTPAMAAGVSNKLWDVHNIVELVESYLAEKIAGEESCGAAPYRTVLQPNRGRARREGLHLSGLIRAKISNISTFSLCIVCLRDAIVSGLSQIITCGVQTE